MFTCVQLGLGSVLRTKYYSSDQINKNEMGGACSMYWGEEKCIQGFGGGRLERPRRRWGRGNIKMDVEEVG